MKSSVAGLQPLKKLVDWPLAKRAYYAYLEKLKRDCKPIIPGFCATPADWAPGVVPISVIRECPHILWHQYARSVRVYAELQIAQSAFALVVHKMAQARLRELGASVEVYVERLLPNGLRLVGRADAVLGDVVVEIKVRRPKGPDVLQAAAYAAALGLRRAALLYPDYVRQLAVTPRLARAAARALKMQYKAVTAPEPPPRPYLRCVNCAYKKLCDHWSRKE